tara:strand:- start:1473 stop:1697 length:225 start_codon:yes stop_codon:yes gene_type:complete
MSKIARKSYKEIEKMFDDMGDDPIQSRGFMGNKPKQMKQYASRGGRQEKNPRQNVAEYMQIIRNKIKDLKNANN